MHPPIRIKVTKKTAPDLERFAAALLALAIARVEEAERPEPADRQPEEDGD
jgi:hypothetical protein